MIGRIFPHCFDGRGCYGGVRDRPGNYRCIYESENVAQFASDLKPFGAVDFLLAFRPVSKEMLERKKDVPVFGGKIMLSVLAPEDIIGISKIMKNGSGNGKGNGEDADALNRDFRILEENRKKFRPITGEFKM